MAISFSYVTISFSYVAKTYSQRILLTPQGFMMTELYKRHTF